MRLRSILASTTLVAVLCGSVLVACGNDDDSAADSASVTEAAAASTETTETTETTAAATTDTTAGDGAGEGAGEGDGEGDGEPGYTLAPDAEVAKGLPEVVALAASIAGKVEAGAPADATATVEELYDRWLSVEGTVKAHDEDTYLDIEDAMTLVKLGQEDGDGAKARDGADSLGRLVDAYLAKFPGDGSEPPLSSVVAKPVEHEVHVELSDYKITLPTPVPSGVVEFEFENSGKEIHEFLILRTDLAPEQLPKDAEGNVDERGAGVTLVDEKEGIKGGEDTALVVDLEPGSYVFLCNVAGHYAQKMYLAATVS